MPIPVVAVMLASLFTVTLPNTAAAGGLAGEVVPPRKPATIPAGSLPVELPPELIVPDVDTRIVLGALMVPTAVPWFSAKIPDAPALMLVPGTVLTSILPEDVPIAKIPVAAVLPIIAPPPMTMFSVPSPLVSALMPAWLADTLP